MTTARFAHLLALPVFSAGILGAALGLAGSAHAETGIVDNSTVISTTDHSGSYSYKATPTTYAHPAANYIPWAEVVEEGRDPYNAASLSRDLDAALAHP